MTLPVDFAARCWGGPLDGQWVAAEGPTLTVARHKPLRLNDPADMHVSFYRDQYTFERVACGSYLFPAWIIGAPEERREAVMQTVLCGLSVVANWRRLLGHTDSE